MISLNIGGEHKIKVDNKFRASVPFRIREKLELRCKLAEERLNAEKKASGQNGDLKGIYDLISEAVSREVKRCCEKPDGDVDSAAAGKSEKEAEKEKQPLRLWLTKGLEPPVKRPLDEKNSRYEVFLKQFIWCLPPDVFDRMVGKIDSLPKNEVTLELRNHLIRSAHEVEIDIAGRILLPQQLRSYADIGVGEVIVIGDGATFQMWSKKSYRMLVDTKGREEELFKAYQEYEINI